MGGVGGISVQFFNPCVVYVRIALNVSRVVGWNTKHRE